MLANSVVRLLIAEGLYELENVNVAVRNVAVSSCGNPLLVVKVWFMFTFLVD